MITVVAVILTEKENGTFQTIKRLTLDPSVAGSNLIGVIYVLPFSRVLTSCS